MVNLTGAQSLRAAPIWTLGRTTVDWRKLRIDPMSVLGVGAKSKDFSQTAGLSRLSEWAHPELSHLPRMSGAKNAVAAIEGGCGGPERAVIYIQFLS